MSRFPEQLIYSLIVPSRLPNVSNDRLCFDKTGALLFAFVPAIFFSSSLLCIISSIEFNLIEIYSL